jgi:RNA polymerase sigma-70 factor (ECF subfamily)
MKKDAYVEKAWNDYSKKLLNLIRNKVKTHQDAEDILAEVFVKLANQTELSKVPHKLSVWLYLVTKNTIIDYYRSQKPFEALPDDLIAEAQEAPQAIASLSACIIPIIEELPETYRAPLLLSEIAGKSQKQVAEELEISLPAVKSRILRGRKRVKNLMAKRCTFYRDESGQLVDFNEKI